MKISKGQKYALAALVLLVGVWINLPSKHTEKYVEVVNKVQEKTVMIRVPTIQAQLVLTFTPSGMEIHEATVPVTLLGSGVFVSKSGLVLTCAHVVDHTPRSPIIATLSDGTTVPAFVIYKDTTTDLALLRLKPYSIGFGKHRLYLHYSPASLSEQDLQLGQEVIVVGNPEGQEFSTSHGIISHLDRDIDETYLFTQIDAPVNGGNSGGPVFNLQGELIGIVAQKWTGDDGMGLAIAPQTIKEFLELFK